VLPRVTVVDGNDARYIVMTRDYISGFIFKDGQFDSLSLYIARLFCDVQEKHHVILDIGANIGTFSIPIAKNLVGKGSVISFEPQRIVFYQLCGNIVLNRLDNVTAHNLALSDQSGRLYLPEIDYNKNTNHGGISFNDSYNSMNGNAVDNKVQVLIEAVALDDLELPDQVSLLKIDVEGFEQKVLLGGRKFLGRHNFPPILFEAWPYEWFTQEREALLGFVSDELGYELFPYDSHGNFIAQHPQHRYRFDFRLQEGRLFWTR